MSGSVKVLLVEDSVEDANLIFEIFAEENITADLTVVCDGEECMKHLLDCQEANTAALPDLILLDLNLPKKDGREVLMEIKRHPDLRVIPVIVMTTSRSAEDISSSYNLQASCYVTKPLGLEQFSKVITSMNEFWLSTVQFPQHNHHE